MAILQCKICGGSIELSDDKTFGTCENCGCTMTFPKIDDEQRAAAFNRGNHFRRIGEFDKALSVYEHIVQENENDAEAHWCCALCRFGIEYVEDPATFEWLPTCHRASFDSFLEDVDYLAALEHSDGITRRQYQKDAAKIAEVQRGILATSQNAEPYDVFICYKESDENGRRTVDSTLAQDIYYQLTEQGRKVFFARITLEDVVGTQYEPFIFAALNSAKVMIVVGTKPAYLNAVWVKNEWSRFLAMMKKDRHKLLLPCYRDMDPYDLPEQLSVLQSYDMAKIGFIQDLIRGVSKVLDAEKKPEVVKETVVVNNTAPATNIAPLLKRAFMFLEDGDWQSANEYCEKVLDIDPECAMAYVGKLMAELKVKKESDLKNQAKPFDNNANYQKSVRFADDGLKATLTGYIDFIVNRNLETAYQRAATAMYAAESENDFKAAAEQFNRIKTYKDSAELAEKCVTLAEESRIKAEEAAEAARLEKAYCEATDKMRTADSPDAYRTAALMFQKIRGYRNAAELVERCMKKADEVRKDAILENAVKYISRDNIGNLRMAIHTLEPISGWRDADDLIARCNTRIAQIEAEEAAAAAEYEERMRKKKAITIVAITALVLVAAIIALLFVEIIPGGKYKDAVAMMENGRYEEAIVAFQELGDYKDSKDKIDQCEYRQAEIFQQNGEIVKAAMAFGKAGDYLDAKTRSFALWEQVAVRDTISAGGNHTVGLKADGTVVAVGDNYYDQRNVTGWTDIIAISAGGNHTVGLKADGTGVAVGKNDDGRCNVTGWTDVVAISAGGYHTVGLKADGTVVAVGRNDYGQCKVTGWTDIIAISAGQYHTIGLKADGTVVAVGSNYIGQCKVTGWTDIIAISAGGDHTVGLKADGTVVAVGYNDEGQCDVTGWTDIIAISARSNYTVGLKADGTVVAVGSNYYGQCDVTGWTDIIAISAGGWHTVGLKADGTVVAVGSNYDGQCDVTDWTGIKIPKK